MINFLFNGSWGFMPKPVFWFVLGLLAAYLNERGGDDGVIEPLSIGFAQGGIVLGLYSLWLSVKSEK